MGMTDTIATLTSSHYSDEIETIALEIQEEFSHGNLKTQIFRNLDCLVVMENKCKKMQMQKNVHSNPKSKCTQRSTCTNRMLIVIAIIVFILFALAMLDVYARIRLHKKFKFGSWNIR